MPPTDEASSILRLLNFLPWDDPITPLILCGPFYIGVEYFQTNNFTPPHRVTDLPYSPFPEKFNEVDDAVTNLLKWRMNVLAMLTSQAGVLSEYFPSENRRTVLSRLYTCFDSLFPLIDALEVIFSSDGAEKRTLCVQEIYSRGLAPEQNAFRVVDSSMTSFIPLLLPHILTGTSPIPPLAYELAGCPVNDPSMDQFVNLMRQICVKREKMRNFLGTLFNTLCGDGLTNWLRDTIVVIVKTALLGNYPDATAFVDIRYRRKVYHLNHETILQYLGSCAGDRSQMRETELAAALSLLATSLCAGFSLNSIDNLPMDQFVIGWPAFFRTNQRTMQLLVDFYPQPPPSNLMLDSFRFLQPLQRRFENIFYLIHSMQNMPLEYMRWWPVLNALKGKFGDNLVHLTRINEVEVAILLHIDINTLHLMQNGFDHAAIFTHHDLSDTQWQNLASLARYLVDRWATRVEPGSQALFFEQSARMYAITGRLAKEKSTILYCQKCNTVRFRPVGVHLPASHITLLADLNFTRLYCVDCDGSDIVPINVMGQFIRCYLSTKKTRTLVTLTLCSACMHICVVGFFSTNSGVICSECQNTVQALISLPPTKHCRACGVLVQRPDPELYWTVFDSQKNLKTVIWCGRCTPANIRHLRVDSKNPKYGKIVKNPLFDMQTISTVSNAPYSVPMKFRHY